MTHVKNLALLPPKQRQNRTLAQDPQGRLHPRARRPLSLDDARRIVADYVEHYNTVRLHSAIGYVTPKDKLEGRDPEIFAARDRKLAEARERRKQQRQANPRGPAQPAARPAIDFAAVGAAVTMAAVLHLLGFQPRHQPRRPTARPLPVARRHGRRRSLLLRQPGGPHLPLLPLRPVGQRPRPLGPRHQPEPPTTRPWICASAWASPCPSCRRRRPATEKRNP